MLSDLGKRSSIWKFLTTMRITQHARCFPTYLQVYSYFENFSILNGENEAFTKQ